MKSIKPGRAPSMMGGFAAVFGVLFGIIWTLVAANMGAPGFFPLFGVVFILFGIVLAVYNFKNATSKNRFSAFDITSGNEESDPLNEYFGSKNAAKDPFDPRNEKERPAGGGDRDRGASSVYCPYCGVPLDSGFVYCPKCGRQLP